MSGRWDYTHRWVEADAYAMKCRDCGIWKRPRLRPCPSFVEPDPEMMVIYAELANKGVTPEQAMAGMRWLLKRGGR